MSATEELLEGIESEFNASSELKDSSNLAGSDLLQAAKRKTEHARSLIEGSVSVGTAFQVARLLGECYGVAMQYGNKRNELEVRSVLAHAIARMLAPSRDECRRDASRRFFEIAEESSRIRDRTAAAIDLTNGALCLIELHNPTADEVAESVKACQKSLGMRERNSVDFAYAQLNVALVKRKALPYTNEPDWPGAYKQILKDLDRAYRVFKKFPFESAEYKSKYFHNVLETLEYWFRYELAVSRNALDAAASSAVEYRASQAGLKPIDYIVALRANPAVLGFPVTPDWVPTNLAITLKALPRIGQIRERIAKAEKYTEDSSRRNTSLMLKLFRLKSMLSEVDGRPVFPWSAMDRLWEKLDWEHYFIYASDILQWDLADDPSASFEYPQMLTRISQCVVKFRKEWSQADVAGFLSRNPITFRFAACELARLRHWEAAFGLLEYSRGINSSRSWNEDPSLYEKIEDSISWVHVTHSPHASYVIVRTEGSYKGAEFKELSGTKLVPNFTNFMSGGMLRAGDIGRARSAVIAESIEKLCTPLADWIAEETGGSLVLMSGGYYQGFPLWACGGLGKKLISGEKQVTLAPSRTVAMRNSLSGVPPGVEPGMFLAEASAVPGCAELNWSRYEKGVVEKSIGAKIPTIAEDATIGNVLEGIGKYRLFHFTGHSIAREDPLDSALITYSGEVKVRSILDIQCSADLAFFGSCESGLAMNFSMQDEMLSIQTASYYSGARMALGSVWPIADLSGFVFSKLFYENLGTVVNRNDGVISDFDIVSSYSQSIAWMSRATVSDVIALTDGLGSHTAVVDPSVRAFRFYDWAAFGLVGFDGAHLRLDR
ncbi:CHAT domain-containing protein [Rhodococcus sp. 05-2255-1e]|uniref:CHAT domain-containing protein n=1 Tax=Rhodococcus sp. 05-2255-1e TaxID=2022495 RepID=UPI0011798E97|nr:CHAT domain-containing protein [Rhodococcus sp. 05-2255-1e]